MVFVPGQSPSARAPRTSPISSPAPDQRPEGNLWHRGWPLALVIPSKRGISPTSSGSNAGGRNRAVSMAASWGMEGGNQSRQGGHG
jgi:hypothetical protein